MKIWHSVTFFNSKNYFSTYFYESREIPVVGHNIQRRARYSEKFLVPCGIIRLLDFEFNLEPDRRYIQKET